VAQLNKTISLARGSVTKLTNNGQAIGAGTLLFTLPGNPGGPPVNAIFQAVGTLTGLTSTLQADLSGSPTGANLATYVSSLLTAAGPLAAVSSAGATPIVPGVLYAVNITALTGGPADVYVAI